MIYLEEENSYPIALGMIENFSQDQRCLFACIKTIRKLSKTTTTGKVNPDLFLGSKPNTKPCNHTSYLMSTTTLNQ